MDISMDIHIHGKPASLFKQSSCIIKIVVAVSFGFV